MICGKNPEEAYAMQTKIGIRYITSENGTDSPQDAQMWVPWYAGSTARRTIQATTLQKKFWVIEFLTHHVYALYISSNKNWFNSAKQPCTIDNNANPFTYLLKTGCQFAILLKKKRAFCSYQCRYGRGVIGERAFLAVWNLGTMTNALFLQANFSSSDDSAKKIVYYTCVFDLFVPITFKVLARRNLNIQFTVSDITEQHDSFLGEIFSRFMHWDRKVNIIHLKTGIVSL